MRDLRIFVSCLFCLTFFPLEQLFASEIGDYDGDGRSDLVVVSVDRNAKNTRWYIRSSKTGNVFRLSLSAPGDALVAGRFFGGEQTYPGIVYVSDLKKPLDWHILLPNRKELKFKYGSPGDQIPNQGDFDCDGITDLAVIRPGKGWMSVFKVWYIHLSSNPGVVQEILFGMEGDKLYSADIDGDRCSEMVALRKGFYWFTKEPFSPELQMVQWGVDGDHPMLPADINGDGLTDYVVSRSSGSKQIAYIRFSAVEWQNKTLGDTNSIPMLGKFEKGLSFAWHDREGKEVGLSLGNADKSLDFGRDDSAVIKPDGIVIQPNESGRFGASIESNKPTVGVGDGVISCDKNLRLHDGSGGFKNNPENSKRSVKVIYPNFMTNRIKEVKAAKDGKFIDNFWYGGSNEWGNRERYYGTKSLSWYPKDLLVVAFMKDGSQICVKIPDPRRVYD